MVSPRGKKLTRSGPFPVPEDGCHNFSVWWWGFEFFHCWWVCVAPLHWLLLILRCVKRYPGFISCHNTVQKVGGILIRHGHFKHTASTTLPWMWQVNSALSYGSYITWQHCHFWKKKNPLHFYWSCMFTFRISLIYMRRSSIWTVLTPKIVVELYEGPKQDLEVHNSCSSGLSAWRNWNNYLFPHPPK
jgi:hypothetical protein